MCGRFVNHCFVVLDCLFIMMKHKRIVKLRATFFSFVWAERHRPVKMTRRVVWRTVVSKQYHTWSCAVGLTVLTDVVIMMTIFSSSTSSPVPPHSRLSVLCGSRVCSSLFLLPGLIRLREQTRYPVIIRSFHRIERAGREKREGFSFSSINSSGNKLKVPLSETLNPGCTAGTAGWPAKNKNKKPSEASGQKVIFLMMRVCVFLVFNKWIINLEMIKRQSAPAVIYKATRTKLHTQLQIRLPSERQQYLFFILGSRQNIHQ